MDQAAAWSRDRSDAGSSRYNEEAAVTTIANSAQLMDVLWQQLQNNTLDLPSLPEIALRIGKLVEDPDVDAHRLAAELSHDPAIAAQVVRYANNAAFRAGAPVHQLPKAIMRIGTNATRHLVSALSVRQLFRSESAVLQKRLHDTWNRSLEVAAMAQCLARRYGALEPEVALLAGLLHQIGILPIVRLLESSDAPRKAPEQIDAAITALQPRAGQLMLNAWNFPASIAQVPLQCMDLQRRHLGEVADYVDIVSIAILQLDAHYDSGGIEHERESIPAFARLGMETGIDAFTLDGVQQEFDDFIGLMKA
jgi:HD-like signal output (HDOD) protein